MTAALAEETAQAGAMTGDKETASDAGSGGAAGTIKEFKDQGNLAFTKAKVLKKTTAGKQYLQDAKIAYIEAIKRLAEETVSDESLFLVCTLHSNLAAVYLQETPPRWAEAKAAADIALSVEAKHVKALFRRGQACLEDGRSGLPEANMREALSAFDAGLEVEPQNAQLQAEAQRIRRRLEAIEAARRVPGPREIADRIPKGLLDRGGDCLEAHGYVWGQTETVVHLFIPTKGARLSKAAEVSFEVRPKTLHVALRPGGAGAGGAAAPEAAPAPVFELRAPLHKPVQPDECSWQLEDKGLLLHVELHKRLSATRKDAEAHEEGSEHWRCVFAGHAETMAPSAKERKDLQDLASKAGRAEAAERSREPEPEHPKKEETLRKFREMYPGVPVEWGNTDPAAWQT